MAEKILQFPGNSNSLKKNKRKEELPEASIAKIEDFQIIAFLKTISKIKQKKSHIDWSGTFAQDHQKAVKRYSNEELIKFATAAKEGDMERQPLLYAAFAIELGKRHPEYKKVLELEDQE